VRIDRDRGGLNASGRCAADLAVRRAAAVHAPGIHGRQVGACSVPRRIASHASRRFPGPRPGVRQRQHACAGSSRTGPACCTAWTPTPAAT